MRTLATNYLAYDSQSLGVSRRGFQASRHNLGTLSEKSSERFQCDNFGSHALGAHSLPGLVVQMIVQRSGPDLGVTQFGNFGIKAVLIKESAPTKAVLKKYIKNGILVHHG